MKTKEGMIKKKAKNKNPDLETIETLLVFFTNLEVVNHSGLNTRLRIIHIGKDLQDH